MLLDAIYCGLLLSPLAFFWCACCQKCWACPGGVSPAVQVTFPDLLPTDDCGYCAELAATIFTLLGPGAGGDGQPCQWSYDPITDEVFAIQLKLMAEEPITTEEFDLLCTVFQEVFCIPPNDGAEYGETRPSDGRYRIFMGVSLYFGVLTLTVGWCNPYNECLPTITFVGTMPDHVDGQGPCPAQTVSLAFSHYSPDVPSPVCDFAAISVPVVFS